MDKIFKILTKIVIFKKFRQKSKFPITLTKLRFSKILAKIDFFQSFEQIDSFEKFDKHRDFLKKKFQSRNFSGNFE